jgi:hypothetical protein
MRLIGRADHLLFFAICKIQEADIQEHRHSDDGGLRRGGGSGAGDVHLDLVAVELDAGARGVLE